MNFSLMSAGVWGVDRQALPAPYTDILAPDGKTGWDTSPRGVAVEVRGRGASWKVVLVEEGKTHGLTGRAQPQP